MSRGILALVPKCPDSSAPVKIWCRIVSRHFGTILYRCRTVLVPKCLGAEVSGKRLKHDWTDGTAMQTGQSIKTGQLYSYLYYSICQNDKPIQTGRLGCHRSSFASLTPLVQLYNTDMITAHLYRLGFMTTCLLSRTHIQIQALRVVPFARLLCFVNVRYR